MIQITFFFYNKTHPVHRQKKTDSPMSLSSSHSRMLWTQPLRTFTYFSWHTLSEISENLNNFSLKVFFFHFRFHFKMKINGKISQIFKRNLTIRHVGPYWSYIADRKVFFFNNRDKTLVQQASLLFEHILSSNFWYFQW